MTQKSNRNCSNIKSIITNFFKCNSKRRNSTNYTHTKQLNNDFIWVGLGVQFPN